MLYTPYIAGKKRKRKQTIFPLYSAQLSSAFFHQHSTLQSYCLRLREKKEDLFKLSSQSHHRKKRSEDTSKNFKHEFMKRKWQYIYSFCIFAFVFFCFSALCVSSVCFSYFSFLLFAYLSWNLALFFFHSPLLYQNNRKNRNKSR